MEGKNTFLSLKIDIDNSSYSSTLGKSKNTLLSIAIAIGAQNSIRTGWSIDGSCYDNSTGLPKLINSKAENATDFWTINLNHISGSVLRLGVTDETSPVSTIAFVPPLSPIELKGDTRNLPINISLADILPAMTTDIISVDIISVFFVTDITGNGFWLYCKNEQIEIDDIVIIGNYIKQFCYPQQIGSVLNGLCRIERHREPDTGTTFGIVYYFDGSWQSAIVDPGQVLSALDLSVANKVVLSPVLLKNSSSNNPYGYLSSNSLSYFNNTISVSDTGHILDNGNFIVTFLKIPSNKPFALGWSPENDVTANPFAPST